MNLNIQVLNQSQYKLLWFEKIRDIILLLEYYHYYYREISWKN
jgi:hypothetical protein